MRLKLFHAPTVTDALALVRDALGPDALILSTRATADGVEITAALEPEDAGPPPPPAPAADAAEERARCLAWHGVPAPLAARLCVGALDEALATTLRFAPLPLGATHPPLLLVGPPGAGKTLTAARLAARLVLAGHAPLVITADAERAGAIEQLAAFTRLLDIDLVVAQRPETVLRALARRDGRPVLIDGPGLDPFEPASREVIEALVGTGAEPALVLPAGLDPAEAADLAQAHAELGARAVIATRLDHARRLGGLLAAADAAHLALGEAGVGPGAADGLVTLTPALLAARLRAAPRAGPRPARAAPQAPLPPGVRRLVPYPGAPSPFPPAPRAPIPSAPPPSASSGDAGSPAFTRLPAFAGLAGPGDPPAPHFTPIGLVEGRDTMPPRPDGARRAE